MKNQRKNKMGVLRNLIINRGFTNLVRIIIDDFLPPIIRDSKWFMKIFFKFAYKGNDVEKYMNFKENIYCLDNDELEKIYENYESIGTERETDLSPKSIDYIFKNIQSENKTLLDVACGRGYFAKKAIKNGYEVTGGDLLSKVDIEGGKYIKSNIEELPFNDRSFDVVCSSHTLEHVINLQKAVSEIKRVAKNQVIITVPCQRYYFYTVDLHIHFFPKKEMLINLMDIENHTIKKVGADWVYIGNLNPKS